MFWLFPGGKVPLLTTVTLPDTAVGWFFTVTVQEYVFVLTAGGAAMVSFPVRLQA